MGSQASYFANGTGVRSDVAAQHRVLLWHPSVLVSDALSVLLATRAPEIEIHQAESSDRAMSMVADSGPYALALWAIDRAQSDIARMLQAMRAVQPALRLGVLTDGDGTLHPDLAALSPGVIPTTSGGHQAVGIVRLLLSDGVVPSPDLTSEGLSASARLRARRPGSALSRRQGDVLGLLARGASNKTIARELGMRENTVKTHVKQIMRRLGVKNRTEAALLAVRELMAPV